MADFANTGERQGEAGSVMLVEDDSAVRDSLCLLLQLHGYRTHAFESAEDFLAAPIPQRPACALIDIRLPRMSGLALQARIGRSDSSLPVLLMTAQGDAAITRAALLQGAIDVLDKPIDEVELLGAVAAAMLRAGEQAQVQREREALVARLGTLTRHERALFEQLTDGRPTREIAREFALTMESFEAQQARLMDKLQARRVSDLIRMRFRLGELVSGRPAAP